MKKLIVHIGRPKTGTSALQAFLRRNQSYLNKLDYTYLNYENSENSNFPFRHCSPSTYKKLNNENKLLAINEAKSFMEERIKNNKVAILSSENISNFKKGVFNDIFDDYDVKIIAYVRNEIEFIASSYAQYIHANWVDLDFSDYLSDLRIHLSMNDTYLGKIATFKNKKIVVRKYDKDELEHQDIRKDFIVNALGLDLDKTHFDFTAEANSNPSLTDAVIEFKKELVRRSNNEFSEKKFYKSFAQLSEIYGSKYRFPMDQKIRILKKLELIDGRVIGRYGLHHSMDDYKNYEFSSGVPKINFKEMFDCLMDLSQ